MKLNFLLLAAFFVSHVVADTITYHLKFTCSHKNHFIVVARGIEVDNVIDETEDARTYECKTSPCYINHAWYQKDDGMFDEEYELKFAMDHTCVDSPNPLDFRKVVLQDTNGQPWKRPVFQNSGIDIDFKV